MCQIFAGKASQIRSTLLNTAYLLQDLYDSNPDGIGAMYATSKGKLRTPKIVPSNLRQAETFIRQLPDDDRNLVIHFRWKTSGNVDQDNAHPFTVLPNFVAMTHNGVLSIDTKSDVTKCDTRHYIDRVLRPQLEDHMELAQVKEWLSMVGRDIGTGNRFVFMDREGNMSFVNRHTGIEFEGMWIANTYSFDASLLIPGYKKPAPKGNYWDRDETFFGLPKGWTGMGKADAEDADLIEEPAAEMLADDLWAAVLDADASEVCDMLLDRPNFSLRTLFVDSYFQCSVDPATEMGPADADIVGRLVDEDVATLTSRILASDSNARKIAEVICWYGEWYSKPMEPADDDTDADDATDVAQLVRQAGVEVGSEMYAG